MRLTMELLTASISDTCMEGIHKLTWDKIYCAEWLTERMFHIDQETYLA